MKIGLISDTRHSISGFNPGSAGPGRFKLPVTLAILEIQPDAIEPRLVSLLDPPT